MTITRRSGNTERLIALLAAIPAGLRHRWFRTTGSRPVSKPRHRAAGTPQSVGGWLFGLLLLSVACSQAHADDDRWASLQQTFFGDRPIVEDEGVIAIEAPGRAYDAAVVPIRMLSLDPGRPIRQVHLLVDQNPLPLAGVFRFAESASDWQSLETRIRIDAYTTVRAIGELSDGSLHMASAFVKASGGCSAPALADLDAAVANAGRMRLLLNQIDAHDEVALASDAGSADQPQSIGQTAAPATGAGERPAQWQTEAVIKISHPNNSGMQFDQISRHYIPAFYIHTIGATLAGQPLIDVETNFSLSENPVIDVKFRDRIEQAELSAFALDSEGNRYERSLSPAD